MSPETQPKRRDALSLNTYVTLGTAVMLLGGCVWLWSILSSFGTNFTTLQAGQAAQGKQLDTLSQEQQHTRDEVAEVGDAGQATAIQVAALKELVTFQLSTMSESQKSEFQEMKARLTAAEERLRLVETAGAQK